MAEKRREGLEAMAEYQAQEADIGPKIARLRAVRLAHALEEEQMASNEPVGDGRRIGAVKKRSQLKTKVMGEPHWTKRNKETGQFMDQKKKGKFKGVRKEKAA